MKKYVLILISILLLVGCTKKEETVQKKVTVDINDYDHDCDYIDIYEDDNLSFRSFCSPEFYVEIGEEKITLKEAIDRKLMDVEDVLDGLEIVGTHENGDVELIDRENTYFVYKCKNRVLRFTEEKEKIIISVLGYGDLICDL